MQPAPSPFTRLAALIKRLAKAAMEAPFQALEEPLDTSGASPAKEPRPTRQPAVAVQARVDPGRFALASNDEHIELAGGGMPHPSSRSRTAAPALFFEPRNSTSFERTALESSLRRAIERGELVLHYQPRLDAMTGHVVAMEALLRWQHPELGLVSPAQFMQLAEDTGLIVPIGKWVLRTACAQTAAWQQRGLDDIVLSVNISPRQLADGQLLGDVAATLSHTGMDARRLEFEITEEALTDDVDHGRKLLIALQSLGVRIALDNFGTGWSSLATLTRFSIDTLMIDRSLVRDLDIGHESRGLTEAIITMGKALKLRILAEGVETQVQHEFLRDIGCDELQGHHFCKPLPADEFEAFACRRRAVPLEPHATTAQYG